jgi:predicted nucleic acid-binding protein
MICYFDSSALVKRYVREAGSDEVRDLLLASTPATARFSIIEIISALSRRCRDGDISAADRDAALAALKEDANRIFLIELSPQVSELAGQMLTSYALRAEDAVQLASCLHLRERTGARVRLVAYDSRLLEASRAEGLDV